MKHLVLSLLLCLLSSAPVLADGLEDFLGELDRQAASDRAGFSESVGRHYGIPAREVEDVMRSTGRASDAFMIFELGRMTGLSRDRVMRTYEDRKGQGWGAMAQEMGIKPGSEEFHALKRGDFEYRRGYSDKRDGKGKGKGSDDSYDDQSRDKGKGKGSDDSYEDQSRGKGKGQGSGSGKGGKGSAVEDELLPKGQGSGQGGGKGKKK